MAGVDAATDTHTADLVPSETVAERQTRRAVPRWAWVTGGLLSNLFVGVALAAPPESEPSRVGTKPSPTVRSTSTTHQRVTSTSTSTTSTTTSTTTTTTLPPPPPTTTTTTTTPPTSNCDSNYTPCVPAAYDVDCAGGSGNGPAYVTGPVQVIGTDIYGLDSDHDRIGCE